MGLTIDEIPQLKRGFELSSLPLFEGKAAEIRIQSDEPEELDAWAGFFHPFLLPAGWQRMRVSTGRAGHYASSSSNCE